MTKYRIIWLSAGEYYHTWHDTYKHAVDEVELNRKYTPEFQFIRIDLVWRSN